MGSPRRASPEVCASAPQRSVNGGFREHQHRPTPGTWCTSNWTVAHTNHVEGANATRRPKRHTQRDAHPSRRDPRCPLPSRASLTPGERNKCAHRSQTQERRRKQLRESRAGDHWQVSFRCTPRGVAAQRRKQNWKAGEKTACSSCWPAYVCKGCCC